jgi:hypothetical protein
MIKKYLHIGPGSVLISYGERVLGVGTDGLAVVLRRELLVTDRRSEFRKHSVGLIQLTPPDEQPSLQQPEVGVVMRRWIELQRPLDHRGRSGPLPQSEERLGGVSGEHRAQ